MKGPTIEEVRALQQETGEGMMACKKILEQRYAEEYKAEMLGRLDDLRYNVNSRNMDMGEAITDIYKLLDYLVRKA
jgi:hypothetical protein